jgi:hypothetical protein
MTPAADLRRPSWGKLLAEAPALLRLLAAQLRRPKAEGPRADGPPVIVVPAFLANDLPTSLLRRTLTANGFPARGWGQGVNRGADPGRLAGLLRRIDIAAAASGRAVVLIGWSLGGLYAREAAKRRAGKVALVLTLGTPFSHGLRRNNAWKLYEAVNDHDVDHPPIDVDPAAKPPVPTVAIWSARDGIVAPASASGEPGERDEAIEVGCRHNELVSDPQALAAILDVMRRLSTPRSYTPPAR